MSTASFNLWVIRHAETAWSLSGQHTGRTDLPLTASGEAQAAGLKPLLGGKTFSLVMTSPLKRAADTCRIAGYGEVAVPEPLLMEWDYGAFEGRTSPEIRKEYPGWTIWTGEVPKGESKADVAARTDRVIERAAKIGGDVAVFAHGHVLRVLAARWLGLPPEDGRLLALDPASVSVLGFEHETRVLRRWNTTVAR
jgi:broad specificity phosphatase PhoE